MSLFEILLLIVLAPFAVMAAVFTTVMFMGIYLVLNDVIHAWRVGKP